MKRRVASLADRATLPVRLHSRARVFTAMLLSAVLLMGPTVGALAANTPASADSGGQVTVAGVVLPQAIDSALGHLQLNGAGLRRRLLARVYVLSLYTPRKVTSFEAAADPRMPRRLHFIFQRDVSRREFSDVIIKAISSSSTPLEIAQAGVGIAKLGEMVNSRKVLKSGDSLSVDWVPGQGTQILVNGKPEGELIADHALNLAVLRIFLGARPVDVRLKDELLGKAADEAGTATP